MRKNGKLTALLMTMVMSISMIATTAFTAKGDPAIPEKGNLHIHKYLMDDLSKVGDPNDGTKVDEGDIPEGAVPAENITFNIYKVAPDAQGNLPKPGAYTISQDKLILTDADDAEFALEPANPASVTTNKDGIAVAENLPTGYYLVEEQDNAQVTSPAAPFIVSVPMANPNGDGWLTDVHVYPKNETISVEKTTETPSVNVGDIVTWDINVSIPEKIEDAQKYDIVDVLDPALDYVKNSVIITGLPPVSGLPISPSGNYDVTDTVNGEGKHVITVSFTEAGLDEIKAYKSLKVSFQTKVNEKILEKQNGTVGNEAKVEFENSNGDKTDFGTPEETIISTGTIQINKTKASDGTALKGAKFKVAASEEDAKNGTFIKINSNKEIVYKGDAGYDTASDWEITTDDDGIAKFQGIREYIKKSDGTIEYDSYWLVETKAPAGYNMLTAPVKVTFTHDTSVKDDAEHVVVSPIKNTSGFTLPQTGGMGTIVFYVGGIVLIGMAVILVITSRKKKTTE